MNARWWEKADPLQTDELNVVFRQPTDRAESHWMFYSNKLISFSETDSAVVWRIYNSLKNKKQTDFVKVLLPCRKKSVGYQFFTPLLSGIVHAYILFEIFSIKKYTILMQSHHHCLQYNRSLILVLDRTIMGLLSFFGFFGILLGITWFSAFFMFSPSLYVPLFPIWSFCSLVPPAYMSPCSLYDLLRLFPQLICSLVPYMIVLFPCSPSLYVPLFPIWSFRSLLQNMPCFRHPYRNPRNTLLNIYIVFKISIHKKD